jgi:hypothetical protein
LDEGALFFSVSWRGAWLGRRDVRAGRDDALCFITITTTTNLIIIIALISVFIL